MYSGASMKLMPDYSAERAEARRKWNCIFKVLKEKSSQSRILKAKLSFKNEGKIETILFKETWN